jgi:PPE-repeat protein
MNIITNIENTATVTPQPAERILETKNPDPVVVTPPVAEAQPSTLNPQQAQPSTINLDSLLADTQPVAAPVPPAKSPFDLINTPVQQVAQPAVITATVAAAQPMVDKKKGVKIGLFVLLFVALGFLTYFIISTMYPM